MIIEPAAPLLPQSGHMVMLDRVLDYGEDWLNGEADLREDNLFAEHGVLPTWAVLEVLAQGIAALAGVRAQEVGEPVRLGFLLGTRRFHAHIAALPLPCKVKVAVKESMIDAYGFAVYDCTLLDTDGTVLAEAAINVYSPPNIEEMMGESE